MRLCDWRGSRGFGWLVTGALFSQFFFGFGTMASYVLLYVELEKEFPMASASALGWVAAVAWGLSSMMSVVTSPLYERFGHRKVIIFGVFATFTGIIGTTFANQLWVMYITFGVILGAGFNCVFNPSMNLVTAYFPKTNCTRATAGATMGAPMGLLVLCPILDIGFNTIGWRNSYRVLAGVYLLISVPVCTLMQPPQLNHHMELQGEEPSTQAKEAAIDHDRDVDDAETGKLNPAKSAADDNSEMYIPSADHKTKKSIHWKKYVAILRLPEHWYYFFGVCGSTMCAIFNVINLASLLTHSGYKLNDAAFMITSMTIAELATRFLATAFGDCLPCARSLLFPIACFFASASSLALGLYQHYAVVIVYIAIAGISRAIIFCFPYGVAVEMFGAEKSIEMYTSILLAFGIGGLMGSLIPGLSFDLTGSYVASLHLCAALWLVCGILFSIFYISYRRKCMRNPYTVAISSEEVAVKTEHSTDQKQGYLTLASEDVKTEITTDMLSKYLVIVPTTTTKGNNSEVAKHLHDLNEGYVSLLSENANSVHTSGMIDMPVERGCREEVEKVSVV